MTFWGSVNIIVGLIAVLATMGLMLQLFKKYSNRLIRTKESSPMEVMHRIALSPRQGLAVIRIGSRFFAVALGDGGVQLLAELASDDLSNIKPSPTLTSALSAATPSVTSLSSRRPVSKVSKIFSSETENSKRVSYVAPIDDFKAVLSMAMNGTDR